MSSISATSSHPVSRTSATSATVNTAKKKLLEGGFAEQPGGQCFLADPFLAEFPKTV